MELVAENMGLSRPKVLQRLKDALNKHAGAGLSRVQQQPERHGAAPDTKHAGATFGKYQCLVFSPTSPRENEYHLFK
jgi:hypothetical protein